MFKKSAIIFNGPPNSGKDEACLAVGSTNLPMIKHMMFKDKLFELVLAIYNIDEDTFFELYNNRATKDKPTPLLRGESPRSAMIFVSETVIKPHYGKTYFGECASENLIQGMNYFSDGGFDEELEPVYDACQGRVLIVRIFRDGCTYEGDSRKYIENFRRADIIDIKNREGRIAEFRDRVKLLAESFHTACRLM